MAATTATPPAQQLRAVSPFFTRYAWAVLAWNVVVVLWGAFVRATGSGAGCGSHWPLCNGEVTPRAPRIETIIEFTHRLTSGAALIGAVFLLVWAFRAFPRASRVRRAATLSLALLFAEALLGAGLVLFNYVAHDASLGRAVYLSLHLVNTQLLLAALTATAWFSRPAGLANEVRLPRLMIWTLPITLAVSVTGAIVALGDTLFPAASFTEGLRQDFSSNAHFLLRLRVLHPVLAIAAAIFILIACFATLRRCLRPSTQIAAGIGAALVVAQLCAGALNVALLAPVWMQITHLLLANLLWIALVIAVLDQDPRCAHRLFGQPQRR
jgi:cytochrome c oxidase assembly protein subunit 15